MGNPNHDPKTGEFSGGPGGASGSSGSLHDVAKQTGLKVTRESAPQGKMSKKEAKTQLEAARLRQRIERESNIDRWAGKTW